MATKKKRLTLPAGIAVFPKLDVPDEFQPLDKKGNPKGEKKIRYITYVKFSPEDFEKVYAQIKSIADELLGSDEGDYEKLPFKDETEKTDDGKKRKTGAKLLVATSGVKFKPPVFDAKNHKLPDDKVIGGGSKIKLNVSVNDFPGFGGGVNLYINAVQVLDLVEKSTGKSPFDEDEGFTYEDDSEESASPFQADSDEDPTKF